MEGNQRLGRRGEALRNAVAAATIDEIVDVGFDAASIKQIASRAGVHETSIYRRWGTKETLVLDSLAGATGDAVPVPDTGTFRDDLLSIAHSVARFASTPVGVGLLRAIINASAPPAQRQDARLARWSKLAPVFDRAKERGEIRPDVDGLLVLEAILAPIHMRALLGGTDIPDVLPVGVVDLILAGIVN